MELLPCPFCGNKVPKTWWDYKPARDATAFDESYFKGYNIKCCIVHISTIYKEDAIEIWNTRPEIEIGHDDEN